MKGSKKLGMATNGEYRISCGQHFKDGKREYKQFRLGKNLFIAQQIAQALEVAWAGETTTDPEGKKVWCQQSIEKAFAFASPPSAAPQPFSAQIAQMPKVETAVEKKTQSLTLYAAFDLFEKEQLNRFKAKEIGEAHYKSFAYLMKTLKKHIPDQPLHQINTETLKRFRRIVTARPLADCYRPKQRKDENDKPIPLPPKRPISIYTVKNWLMTLGVAFNYFASTTETQMHPNDKQSEQRRKDAPLLSEVLPMCATFIGCLK